jgi:hypothetical protein
MRERERAKGAADMLIETRAIGFTLTEGILRHAEARIQQALGALANGVLRVTVRVDDVNAGRGGVDKRCGVVTALRGLRGRHGGGRGPVIAVEAVREDLYDAIVAAAAKARRAVEHALARSRAGGRKAPLHEVAAAAAEAEAAESAESAESAMMIAPPAVPAPSAARP